MRIATILALAGVVCLTGCSATSPTRSAAPPPFECTSIHPEICELEEKFHQLRFEQAEQNAAIEAAERKRRAEVKTAGTVAANAVPAS